MRTVEVPARATEAAPPASEPDHSEPGWFLALTIVLVAAGVVLRFAARSDLWLDEALTVNVARLPLGDLPDALRRDGAPPLYYVLLHGWTAVFGTSDLAVRALSGVIGVAILPLAWLAGRRLGRRTTATAALVLVATAPFAIRFSTEVRMYGLVMLFVLAGYLLVAGALERPTLPRLAGIAVITAALLYTQYWSWYLLAVVGIGLVARGALVRGPARDATVKVVLALGAGAVLFLPWVPVFLDQIRETGTPWGEPPNVIGGFAGTFVDLGGGIDYWEALLYSMEAAILVVLGLFGTARGRYRIDLDLRTRPGVRAEMAVFVATLAVGLLAGMASGGAYQVRYAAVVVPLLYLVFASGITTFADPRIRAAILVAVAGTGLIGGVRVDAIERTQGGDAGRVIAVGSRADDLVVVCPDQLGPSLTRALGDGPRVVTFPTFDDGRFVDWRDYGERNRAADPEAFAARALEEAGPDARVWYVSANSYRTFEGKCEALFNALGAARPSSERVLSGDNNAYEFMDVTRFDPAP